MSEDLLNWQTHLHARLHDPIEKSLVLLRDPAGHEGGTVRALHDRLFPQGVPASAARAVKRADWWASAGDRPQFPRSDGDGPYARWSQVRFDQDPMLVHPLSGEVHDLAREGRLAEVTTEGVREDSLSWLSRILDEAGLDAEDDVSNVEALRRGAHALWRFGPEIAEARDDDEPVSGLGALWRLLPADTRVPDHTIWSHLDLTTAFASAFIRDGAGECSLLTVTLGPVQSFISAARSTSDLWAGSHLLAHLAWTAMRVVCEANGPEAILFPSLRGVPAVDLWLIDDIGLPRSMFDHADWERAGRTDANPLFSASLPNRFTALVPADRAQALAQSVTDAVRAEARRLAHGAWAHVLDLTGMADEEGVGAAQIDAQIAAFPEVHWSTVPWSRLAPVADEQRNTGLDTAPLRAALSTFLPDDAADAFVQSPTFRLLEDADAARAEGMRFFRANPGILYPDILELGERRLAAAKTFRPFEQLASEGHRCTLTAVDEWITTDRAQLHQSPGRRTATIWARLAETHPSLARPGEHLGATALLKRLWPVLYRRQLEQRFERFDRFVVSTHTMAIASSLSSMLDDEVAVAQLRSFAERHGVDSAPPAALPPRLARRAFALGDIADPIRRLPSWLDEDEDDTDGSGGRRSGMLEKETGLVVDGYYAMLLFDGDRLGALLGGDSDYACRVEEAFHPAIRNTLRRRAETNSALSALLDAPRPNSPARQAALSRALGDFSMILARHVVERCHDGRIIYAGGDDLLAMLPVAQVTSVLRDLRAVYSGTSFGVAPDGLQIGGGYVRCRGRLHTALGSRATASAGVVIAHHQAPMAGVLEALRAAEATAKAAGRNSWALSILKRSGAPLHLAGAFVPADPAGPEDVLGLIEALRGRLAGASGGSRRAVYNSLAWLSVLPEPPRGDPAAEARWRRALGASLHMQFQRQEVERKDERSISVRLAESCPVGSAAQASEWLASLLSTAEFLAREARQS